jgi:hypothetical protein
MKYDAEVPPATAYGPIEVGVFRGTRGHETSVCQNQISSQKVVDRQAMLAREMPQPTSKCQSTNSGGRNEACGHGQTKSMRCVVDSMPRATAPHPHCPIAGVDTGIVDQRKINYEAIITDAQAACVMSAAPHRNEHSILTAKIDCGEDVRGVGTAHDQARPAVDHAIIYLSCFIVALFARLDELASET